MFSPYFTYIFSPYFTYFVWFQRQKTRSQAKLKSRYIFILIGFRGYFRNVIRLNEIDEL